MRPFVLSIAGLDPSAGAGVLADVKTFEQLAVYGLSVCTAITAQTDKKFLSVEWQSSAQIMLQLLPLLERFKIEVVKIGLVQNWEVLLEITSYLHQFGIKKIVWDPVLGTSTGFKFHQEVSKNSFKKALDQVALITPNIPEVKKLTGSGDAILGAELMSEQAATLLKGGHGSSKTERVDLLFRNGEIKKEYAHDFVKNGEKHGSGCILSAAISAHLALGENLENACAKGISYTSNILKSNPTLLGYHTNEKN